MARNFNQTHYVVWLREVDAALLIMCGQVASDLDDAPYAAWHQDGVSAKAAAKRAINYSKEACGF